VDVNGVRIWTAPDHTRLVLDTDAQVQHRIFSLADPDRLVIDLADTRLRSQLPRVGGDDPLVHAIRHGIREGDDLRVVLDLKQPVRPKSFSLRANDRYGPRLVIDLWQKAGDSSSSKPRSSGQAAARPEPGPPAALRDLIVAIDAGHGGEDPGAIGPTGTREKDVVLAVSRKLAHLVEREPGMKSVMIRTGDYYIPLRKRIEKARRLKADLFVSIHADAFRDKRVRGSSVYTLSHRGASSEAARWLAEQENRADLIGGIDLDDKDDLLASVLLDLSQSATIEASLKAAQEVLGNLKHVGAVHKSSVQQAGFVVLKSPDIPSMLVEMAFISNPAEERRLRSSAHQEKLARALMRGIRAYFDRYPPPGTRFARLAARQHVIARGDTLSTIAEQYGISLRALRTANNLADDRIRTGQVLTIPERSSL
jgi:N-acetylmuramoyl-L-alanine amidase